MIRDDSDRGPIRLGWLGLAAGLVAWSVGCASVGPPRPETGYQARGIIQLVDPSAASPALVRFVEFYRTGKRRREFDLDTVGVWIDRPDLRVTWILNPDAKSFEEQPFWKADGVTEPVPDPFGPRIRAHFKPLGSEIIEGVDTEKFEVEGEKISGYAWLTRDQIPFRFSGTLDREGSAVELRIEYTEVDRDEQANHLFEVPMNFAGYETRKQKAKPYDNQADDWVRKLKEQQWGTPSSPPPLPPPVMPQIPPMR